MISHPDPHHIDDYKPFRASKLWELQRNYFKTKGVTAWQGEVPFYISSNAFIAQRYAKLVLAYIKDILNIHPEFYNETFYIAELGSGIGQFSFYFLKAFFKLQDPDNPLKVCYIMTDMVEKNKLFWEQNAYFQSLLKQGYLQFKLWNIENLDNEFILSRASLKTPFMVIANYIFDCIQQDVFQISQNNLYEMQLNIKSPHKNFDPSKAESLKTLKFEYQKLPTTEPYSDAILNKVINQYYPLLEDDVFFTVPLGAIHFLNYLEKWTDNNYMMISGDKGIAHAKQWARVSQEHLFSYEGCYAFMFNFDILARYIQAKGGDSLLTQRMNSFKICLYSSNKAFSELNRTAQIFEHYFEQFGADEFCYLNEMAQSTCDYFSLKGLMSHLRLSYWDMHVYQSLYDRLIELVAPLKIDLESDLVVDIKQVEDHVYYHPGMVNIYNQLGNFYKMIQQPQKAIELYQKALNTWGETPEPHHNLGRVYETLGDKHQAIYHYKQSVSLNKLRNSDSRRYAQRRIQVLTGTPLLEIGRMILRGLFVFAITALVLYYLIFVL